MTPAAPPATRVDVSSRFLRMRPPSGPLPRTFGPYEILNEVVINQVLVSFGPPAVTSRVIEGVQRDGACWCGGTEWQGRTAMRISVSSWVTTEKDVEIAIAAIHRVAQDCLG